MAKFNFFTAPNDLWLEEKSLKVYCQIQSQWCTGSISHAWHLNMSLLLTYEKYSQEENVLEDIAAYCVIHVCLTLHSIQN